MLNILSNEENDALHNFVKFFNELLLLECHKRCPRNHGYEPKCANCDVQYLFWVVTTMFKMKAEGEGLYYAMRWLITKEHNQFEDDPRRNRNLC